jgi:hypothetical protein
LPPCQNSTRLLSLAGAIRLTSTRTAPLIADDFHFTSPLDNRIDRAAYFRRCWPNSAGITGFDFVYMVGDGNRVHVTYEGRNTGGKRFRNTEILTIRDGQIIDAEVYFGWSIPHEAPPDRSMNP